MANKIKIDDWVFHTEYGIGKAYWLGGSIYVDYTSRFNPFSRGHISSQVNGGEWLHKYPAYNCGDENFDGQVVIKAKYNKKALKLIQSEHW